MPELPEVETVCQTLSKKILECKIININIFRPKCIKNVSFSEFTSQLLNKKIKSISRRGKHIIFHLEKDIVLVSHLRMEGRYYFKKIDTPANKHTMISFDLDNGISLRYIDTRQFGTFHLYQENNYLQSKQLSKLGYEPWDEKLTATYLYNITSKTNRRIKSLLLDQTIIAGIGNIYADEILFRCNICPWLISKKLTKNQCQEIIFWTREVLALSIKNKGSTINSYESTQGVEGQFQKILQVHTRVRKPCNICNNVIQKTKVGGRGTYFCSECQKCT